MRRAVCLCDIGARHWYTAGNIHPSTKELEQYIKKRLKDTEKYGFQDLSLDHLKRVVTKYPVDDIGSIREVFEQEMPFKVTGCRSATLCCGMCTKRCSYRCVQDLLHKLYIASFTYEEVYAMIFTKAGQKKCTYKSLCNLCNKIMDERKIHNEPYDTENYSCSVAINWETNTPTIDPNTGGYVRIPWPYSGLCPFCLSEQHIRLPSKHKLR